MRESHEDHCKVQIENRKVQIGNLQLQSRKRLYLFDKTIHPIQYPPFRQFPFCSDRSRRRISAASDRLDPRGLRRSLQGWPMDPGRSYIAGR
jgi:hypothetical protein